MSEERRWSLARTLVVGFCLVLVGAAFQARTAEARSGCSESTPGGRDCTATEALGYCLTNAIESYGECSSGAGFFGKAGCLLAYEFDFYGCYVSVPVGLALK